MPTTGDRDAATDPPICDVCEHSDCSLIRRDQARIAEALAQAGRS